MVFSNHRKQIKCMFLLSYPLSVKKLLSPGQSTNPEPNKLKILQINKGSDLNHNECIKAIQSMIKQIRDSINQFKIGGREDLVAVELEEMIFLESLLPKQMSKDEIKIIVKKIVEEKKGTTLSDLGKIMPAVMVEINGRGDGKTANDILRKILSK